MNNLYSNSSKQYQDLAYVNDIEVGVGGGGGGVGKETIHLEKFFRDVENVKDDMMVVEKLYNMLQESNEESKMIQNVNKMKLLSSKMGSDLAHLLEIVKVIKGKLEALSRSNDEHHKIPDCEPGSSTDRTHTLVVSGLGKKLKLMMDAYQELRSMVNGDYKETIMRRYFTITGENSNYELIINLISSGVSEDFLQRASQDQGREQIMDIISEIQERHDANIIIEKNLMELPKIFLDMVVLVEAQRHNQNGTEIRVAHTVTFVGPGTEQVVEAKKLEKRSQKCTCITISIVATITIMLLILFLLLPKILPLD